MKKTLSLITVLGLLMGCSNKKDVALIKDAKTVYGCDTLNVFNWGEYISEDTIPNFESAFNAKVNYDLYESNEIMYTKLMGGSQYDILIPSDYMIERLIQEDFLQPIDKSIITNLDLLSESVKNPAYDPDHIYSVPYFYGTVGLLYNPDVVDTEEVTKEGFNILLNEKYKGRVYMYDSERDSFMVALKALGYSMNTESEDEIEEAYEWLIENKIKVEPAYVTDEVIDGMSTHQKDIAVMYSGDATNIIHEQGDLVYFTPDSGTNIWSDALVIPKNANCAGLANEFIKFVLDYDNALAISEAVGYTSANAEVVRDLSTNGGEFEGIEAYIPRVGYPKDEEYRYNDTLRKKLSDLWIRVRNH